MPWCLVYNVPTSLSVRKVLNVTTFEKATFFHEILISIIQSIISCSCSIVATQDYHWRYNSPAAAPVNRYD